MKNKLFAALAALTIFGMLLPTVADAKSYGSRSSSSSSSRSSGGSSWGSKSSSSSSSKPSSTKPSSSKPTSSGYTKPASKVEYNRYKDATRSGKAFTTKESATADFKSKYGSQYSSKFTSEPSKRPDYIPSRYRSGGRDYDISYNPRFGGYGYMDALGTFILYDALTDAAQTSRLMSNHGYYVGPPMQKPFPWGTMIVIVLIVGGVVAFVFYFSNRY